MRDAPFRGFAYVHERVRRSRVESPFERKRDRSGWAYAVRRATKLANTLGRTLYIDWLRDMWAIWSGPVYEGQYTSADERYLVDLRQFDRDDGLRVDPVSCARHEDCAAHPAIGRACASARSARVKRDGSRRRLRGGSRRGQR